MTNSQIFSKVLLTPRDFFYFIMGKFAVMPIWHAAKRPMIMGLFLFLFTIVIAIAGAGQVSAAGTIVDDGEGPPKYVDGGQTDDDQPSFWGEITNGYNMGAHYTGNSINSTRHNWATWTAEGVTGAMEVSVNIPAFPIYPGMLTTRATYVVTHAGGETPVDVDQKANEGGSVSLGTFTFAGTGSVYLSDVVAESGDNFLSYIVFDAVNFGGDFADLDTTPPTIELVKSQLDNGRFIIQAKVTDDESGVKEVILFYNGQFYTMTKKGDIYSAAVNYSSRASIDYYIIAEDNAGNSIPWHPTKGYVSRTAFARDLGVPRYSKYPNSSRFKNNAYGACSSCPSDGGFSNDPVNTVNGNHLEQNQILTIGGRPEIDFYLTYNSLGSRVSIFGENWSHSYAYHLIEMDNADFQGVFVTYPDGQTIRFSGPGFTADPGYYERLVKTAEGFELIFKDLSKVKFDTDGEIVRYEDPNGNGLTFTYSEKVPFTLLSKITNIKADGGREISISYNAAGFAEKIDAPEGKVIQFEYNDQDDLTKIINASGGETKFEYTDHYMTKKVSPEGHNYFVNSYDSEGRVIFQTAGENHKEEFIYEPNKTTIKDIYGNKTEYIYVDGLLSEVKDALGRSLKYTYDGNKNTISKTDRDNNTFEYGYDANGNLDYEKDPYGAEVTRIFNLNFNKPTKEVYKVADHVTEWEYDSKGNVKKVIDAFDNDRVFDYNSFGQLIYSEDFNNNPTDYTYNAAGDLETVKDAYTKTKVYEYDGLGRRIKITNERVKVYSFTYDKNDNLKKMDGPLGFSVKYDYDKNNNLIKEVDPNGGPITYKYDNSENLIEKKNQLAFPTTYSYGDMNELLSKRDAEGRVTKYEYDTVFNLKSETHAFGTADQATTQYAYNGMRYQTQITDPEGRIKSLEYDKLQRLITVVENVTANPADSENNVTTKYEYSPTSALKKVTDANGNSTVYSNDKLDRLESIEDAENQITSYTYDAESNLKKEINPRNFATEYFYDKLNRVERIKDAKGGNTEFVYDENSNLTSVKDANGIITAYEYNDLDRSTAQIRNFVSDGTVDASTNVRTEFGYDLFGNLKTVKNPRGFTTTYNYDAAHRNTQVFDAVGKFTKLDYDKVDNLIKVTDRNIHSYSYDYDSLDRLTKLSNPENHSEVYTYDKVGNVTKLVNMRGKEFLKSYDPLNRLKVETDPYAKTKSYTYDSMGNLLTLLDENTHIDKFEYDKVYRLRKAFDAEDFLTEYQYDKNGNTVKLIDGNSNPTGYEYDELDRLITKTNAENEIERYKYDAIESIIQTEEADGTLHKFSYDPLYRISGVVNNYKSAQSTTNDRNVGTKYTYDANGNLTASTDPLTHTTKFEFNELDRLIKEINPLGSEWEYRYDFEGNLIERTDANEAITGYSYYPDDMLKKIQYPTYAVDYAYSETNIPIEMKDNLGVTSWAYDLLDRMIAQSDPLGRSIAYEYDFVGNVINLKYPDSRSVTHEYLKNDWLKVSTNSDTDSIKYTRDGVGMPTKVERTNSSISTIGYDKVYRTKEVHDKQIGSGNHLISKFNYNYNKVGDITKEIAEYGWRQPSKVTTDFGYDGLHRLSSQTASDGSSSKYKYDAAGNRSELIEKLKQGNEVRTFTYNEANQVTKVDIKSPLPPKNVTRHYKYDKNGNRVDQLIDDKTGINRGVAYTYDFENRLTKAQDYQGDNGKVTNLAHTESAYDGNGRRLVKTYYPGGSEGGKRTEYTYDRLDPIVHTDMWNGQRMNLYRDSNQNLAFYQEFKSEQAPNGTLYWYHYDGEGNIAGTTKHQAQSDHTYRYDEYGAVLPENGNWTEPHNQYTLTQKEFDGNTDLYYFGARHYDAWTGTWITQDSYRGENTNPASLHRYMYNYDSPVNYVDLYGFSSSDPEYGAKVNLYQADLGGSGGCTQGLLQFCGTVQGPNASADLKATNTQLGPSVDAQLSEIGGGVILGNENAALFVEGDLHTAGGDAFVGYKEGSVGAEIGGYVVGVSYGGGFNVYNVTSVAVKAEANLGFQVGIRIGRKTRIAAGPVAINLEFSKPRTSDYYNPNAQQTTRIDEWMEANKKYNELLMRSDLNLSPEALEYLESCGGKLNIVPMSVDPNKLYVGGVPQSQNKLNLQNLNSSGLQLKLDANGDLILK